MTLLPSRREPFLSVLRWLPGGRPETPLPAAAPDERWRTTGVEPPLEDVLADPIVRAVMACDGVSEGELRDVVAAAAPGTPAATEPAPRPRRQATQRPW
jgi:hypothetical protein